MTAASRTQAAIASGLAAAIRAAVSAPKPLTFRGGPLAIQTTDASEWGIGGPADTTKTTAGLWRLFTDLQRTPRARAFMAMRLRASMATTLLGTWDRIVAHRGGGVTKYGGSEPRWYDFPNGARVHVVGLDDGDKILGGEFDFGYGSQLEQWPVESWEKVATRISGRGAVAEHPWLGSDFNPGGPKHWILQRKRLTKFTARHEDNPELFDERGNPTSAHAARMEPLDALTGVRKERLRFGRWVAAEGVVYEDFNRDVHVIRSEDCAAKRAELRGCRFWAAIDFGFTNPFSWQLWAIDGDGRIYLTREIYRTQTLVAAHAARINAITAADGVKVLKTVADPADAEGRATLRNAGIETEAADKRKLIGLQAAKKRFQKAGDGKPRVFFLEDALDAEDANLMIRRLPLRTTDELEVYAYQKGVDGKPNKEEPEDANNHGCDAYRYLVAALDMGPTGGGLRVHQPPPRELGVF